MTAVATSFWTSVLPDPIREDWLAEMQQIARVAESRRALAFYNTGSILVQEAYALRALAEYLTARIVIEVGTFIGFSTEALASASTVERVFTCDSSNDCLDKTAVIKPFAKQTSTQMLSRLCSKGVRADLCFFDGALSTWDVGLLAEVCGPETVFAVHDYNYGPKIRKHGGLETVPRKGIGNARLLHRQWPGLVVVDPLPETTVALLVPEHRL